MTPRRHDHRYRQLLALAHEGSAEAASDLFHEYGIDPDHLPPMEEADTNNTEER